MTEVSKSISGLEGLLVLVVATGLSNQAGAYCRMTTESAVQTPNSPCVEDGAPLFWSNTCLSYAIDARGSRSVNANQTDPMPFSQVQAAIDAAFAAWENADCDGAGTPPNVIFQALESSNCRRAECKSGGNVNTVAFLDPWEDVCRGENDPPYPPAAFAITVVWHNTATGEILDADIMVNDTQASFGSAGGPYTSCPEAGCAEGSRFAPGPADLQSIVTHEVGHFIGIGHCVPNDADDPNDPCVQATMFGSAERNEVSKRTLAPDDINAVCDIYPPGSLEPSCSPTPIGGLELDCETDASGDALACSTTRCSTGGNGGGCSVTRNPADAPWPSLLGALLALTVFRRQRRVRES